MMLSKSKIKDHSKCSMMLWHEVNQPSLKEWDSSNQARFDQGRVIEKIARDTFKDAIEQDKRKNTEKLEYTKELLANPKYKTIFEPAFLYDNVIVQFDMLTKVDDGSYDAVEVKSSSKFKEDYELDVIVQYWVATLSGIKINSFKLWHVNTKSENESDFFTQVDLMELVLKSKDRFLSELEKAKATFYSKEIPQYKVGSHCDKFECPYRNTSQCKVEIKEDSVLGLPYFNKKWDAHNANIKSVNQKEFSEQYPDYSITNPLIVKSIKENKLVIDKEGVRKSISAWKYPLNFFDFEAVMSALPILKGTKPYEQVVMQFSNHIYNGVDNKLAHQMYLHDSKENPNLAVVDHLLSFLSNDGSIVSYNKTYEQTRIKFLAKKYPEHSVKLLSLVDRFVDLMDIVKDHVYHPEFYGSYSLKVVSPVLLKEWGSYSDSLIKNGNEITPYFLEMITTKDIERKTLIKNSLIKYCSYDTINLFLLLKFLLNENENLGEIVELNLGKVA